MGKLAKVLGFFVIVILLIFAGLTALVKFYFTDEKIRAFIIPQAEKSLGRSVAIGDIKIGLMSGITVNDFVISEADNKSTFISTKAFILRYDLMPLLHKELVVNEILLQEPTVRIHRNKNGEFNFDSLTILEKKPASTTHEPGGTVAALPIALTVDQIRIENAQVTLVDDLGELPQVTMTANTKVSVDLGQNLSAIRYKGTLDFKTDLTHGTVKPHISGEGVFDQDQITLTIQTAIDNQQVMLDGKVLNYLKAPDITFDISSKKLDIDNILALAAGLPKAAQEAPGVAPQEKKSAKQTAPAQAIPPGLAARGQIKIDTITGKDIRLDNFLARYQLKEGILDISDLSAQSFGGEINSDLQVDLNRADLAYSGKLGGRSLDVHALSSAYAKQASDVLSGTLGASMNFSASGTEWDAIRQVLTADGNYSLVDGQIKKTEITEAVSGLLGLPELKEISFEDISGVFQIVKGGKVALNSTMKSQHLKAQTDGSINLDGTLNLPLELRLSQELSEKLKNRASVAQYLANEQGETVLNLKLTGTIDTPKASLDSAGVEKAVQTKALEALGGLLSGQKDEGTKEKTEKKTPDNQAQDLIKGLFGR